MKNLDNHEIGQIIEHTLDSGKKRIVGLRTDGQPMIWNWEAGEWTAFMSPHAANKQGLAVSEALLQAGKNFGKSGPAPADDRSRPAYSSVAYRPERSETGEDLIPAHHIDRAPGQARTDWRRP